MFPTNTLSHTTIIRISTLINHYYLILRTPFSSTNCPNKVLYIRKMPCSYMAFNFHVSPISFSLEKLSLWHLWPQHFWQLQASYLVNDPQFFFPLFFMKQVMHLWEAYCRSNVVFFSLHLIRLYIILNCLINDVYFDYLIKLVTARLLHWSYSFSLCN